MIGETETNIPALYGSSKISDSNTVQSAIDPQDRIATQGMMPVMFGDDVKPPGPADAVDPDYTKTFSPANLAAVQIASE
jgi:hypothetical protein